MGIILIIEKTFEEIGEALIEGITTDRILENREMKEENREMKEENREMKEENREMKEENREMKEEMNHLVTLVVIRIVSIPMTVESTLTATVAEDIEKNVSITKIHEISVLKVIIAISTVMRIDFLIVTIILLIRTIVLSIKIDSSVPILDFCLLSKHQNHP